MAKKLDLTPEIELWKEATWGKEVRPAQVSMYEKLETSVNGVIDDVETAASAASDASRNAQKAVDAIQGAITTTTEKASAAASSATASATSASAAAASQKAAGKSQTDAAASAAEAQRIADGLGGFDGTAASVTATDTYGLVVAALGETTAQALIDAIANKVMNELVAKNQIVNNLLATVPGNVLDATQGKELADKDANLQSQITQLNGETLKKTISGNVFSNMRLYANNEIAVFEVSLTSGATYNLVFGYAGDINITRKKSDGTWAPAILLADLL